MEEKNPTEVKNTIDWTTIELNENDRKKLLNHKQLFFTFGGNAKFMIIRVE